jgi:hypothetical protein
MDRFDVFVLVGWFVIPQVRVLPRIHHQDGLATGELVDIVIPNPEIDDLIRGTSRKATPHAPDRGKTQRLCDVAHFPAPCIAQLS